ncbi:MAG: aminoacyl-tRNA hydrolase [Pyrinomonadaceae bacterium]|nr:aminoacyl-tRNA hydrolase [Pyrinomonadaceae bacterium]
MKSDREIAKSDADAEGKSWLIAGLGNPGPEYENTRHNLGFMVVDLLAADFNAQIRRKECRALIGQTVFEEQKVEFAKPQTYMNLSGESIGGLLSKNGRDLERLVVIVDDLNLPFGTIRLRARGSAGGHNGLRSINDCLKTQDYARLRIGIQPEHPLSNSKKFVLERFSRREAKALQEVLRRSADAIRELITEGIEQAMSKFNG